MTLPQAIVWGASCWPTCATRGRTIVPPRPTTSCAASPTAPALAPPACCWRIIFSARGVASNRSEPMSNISRSPPIPSAARAARTPERAPPDCRPVPTPTRGCPISAIRYSASRSVKNSVGARSHASFWRSSQTWQAVRWWSRCRASKAPSRKRWPSCSTPILCRSTRFTRTPAPACGCCVCRISAAPRCRRCSISCARRSLSQRGARSWSELWIP